MDTLEKPFVLLVFRRGRTAVVQRYQAGEGPDDMLYGLNHFDPLRFRVGFIEGDDNHRSWVRRLWRPLEKWIARRTGMGFLLPLALGNVGRLRQADVIITIVDSCGLPIAMLKYLGLVKTPMIYISQGLTDRVNALPSRSTSRRWIRRIYGRFLRSAERILALGEGAIDPLATTFQLSPTTPICLPFGVDAHFWSPSLESDTEDYILSVGSDPARDYETLLNASTGEHLKIVTRLSIPREHLNGRIEVGSDFDDVELRELYRRARVVVIPIKDVEQPSGQSATLQAMACGKAVILTRTRGLWESTQMRHLDNCYLVEPYDADGLRQAILYFGERKDEAVRIGGNARRLVEERYNSRRFTADLERHVSEVLAAIPN